MTSFFVAGVPVPKGSAKAFMRPGARFPTVMQDNASRQKPWASSIGYAAQQAGVGMASGPVKVEVEFFMPRLKSHFGSGRNAGTVKPTAPMIHTSKPDLDKLTRCVLDALTGIAWNDDSQVAEIVVRKTYDVTPGAGITISPINQ